MIMAKMTMLNGEFNGEDSFDWIPMHPESMLNTDDADADADWGV